MSKVSHSAIKSQLGFVPSRPMAPVTNGRSSGNTALPRSLRDARTEHVGNLHDFVGGIECPGTYQNGDPRSGVENVSRPS